MIVSLLKTDADFAAAVIPTGKVLIFPQVVAGGGVRLRYRNSDGQAGELSSPGGSSPGDRSLVVEFFVDVDADAENDPLHFLAEISEDADFATVLDSVNTAEQAGHVECFDPSAGVWTDYPQAGLTSYGRQVVATFTGLTSGRVYYIRQRWSDGELYSKWSGRKVTT